VVGDEASCAWHLIGCQEHFVPRCTFGGVGDGVEDRAREGGGFAGGYGSKGGGTFVYSLAFRHAWEICVNNQWLTKRVAHTLMHGRSVSHPLKNHPKPTYSDHIARTEPLSWMETLISEVLGPQPRKT